jgi:hypothetical protein
VANTAAGLVGGTGVMPGGNICLKLLIMTTLTIYNINYIYFVFLVS